MQASILRTLAIFAALGPAALMAQEPSQGPILVKVPFGFTVGAKSFAAGEYRIREQNPTALSIQSVDGRSAMAIMTHAAQPSPIPGDARLTFNKYGDRYFLAKVSDSDRGWELSPSPVEKELIAKQTPAKPVVLVAGH